jgi:hypothetical protein
MRRTTIRRVGVEVSEFRRYQMLGEILRWRFTTPDLQLIVFGDTADRCEFCDPLDEESVRALWLEFRADLLRRAKYHRKPLPWAETHFKN